MTKTNPGIDASYKPPTMIELSLGRTTKLDDVPGVALSYDGWLRIDCLVDNGSRGNPSTYPHGRFELYTSHDAKTYKMVAAPAMLATLARISPRGNHMFSDTVRFSGVVGIFAKLIYKRTAGGKSSRAMIRFITDINRDDMTGG